MAFINNIRKHRVAALLLCALCCCVSPASANSFLLLKALPGRMIHDATYLPPPDWWPPDYPWNGEGLNTDASYRYGASMIRYDENKLHFWACSEGDPDLDIADYIRYRHSADGGISWSEDSIVLAPTVGSDDGWAVCDPDVIKLGDFYYLAYTATSDSTNGGLDNQIFVARSTSPDGIYYKWNGSGWGGDPAPVVSYNGPADSWGYGEPNMVVVGDTLFFYYTDGEATARTRVATANANSTNWPDTIIQRGYAIANRDYAEDQTDVKYLPEINRFIATAVADRFTIWSYVHVWWSRDGLTFEPVINADVTTNIVPTAHNLGMSGNGLGHAQMGSKEYIAYSYTGPDGSWGRWNTWLSKVDISADSQFNLAGILFLLLDE